jgi:cyclophilin family peptidyl-prolyl cis-trans isomerase
MNFVRTTWLLVAALALFPSVKAQVGLPVLSQPIPNQFLNRGAFEIDLRNHFGVPGVTGQVVQFITSAGRVNVEMRPVEAPRNVANFLTYVSKRAYDNTLIHRVDTLGAVQPAVVHGGLYPVTSISAQPTPIPAEPPVPLEYRLPNTRGTLAAFHARGAPNSATSEWFFNVLDNTNTLGPANDSGYTVFGRVLGTGMSVIDAISQLPTTSIGNGPLNQLPVRNVTSNQSQLTLANLVAVSSVRVVPVYPPTEGDPSAVLSFSIAQPPQSAGIVSASIAGSVLKLNPLAVGTTTLTIQAVDSNGNSSLPTTFSVTIPPDALLPAVFKSQPVSQTTAIGTTVVFTATVTGGESAIFPVQYQWFRDGVPLSAPSSPFLVLRKVTAADAGSYTCVASNSLGSTLSIPATLTVVAAAPSETGRLVNLGIRANAGIFDDKLIVGFGVGGSGTAGSKPLLVRGAGPSLAQYGVPDVLGDPVLALFQNSLGIATNDNWDGEASIANRTAQVGAFPFAPFSLDSAIALSSQPGAYTVQISGKGFDTGNALAEIYDATPGESFNDTTPRLVNLSVRAQVDSNSILISGFVIGGSYPTTVLIRAIGATLSVFGVSGALENPKLQLYNATTLVGENDDWGGDAQLSAVGNSVGAFTLGPSSKDAVMLVTLPPGNYTAHVSGVNNGSGIALMEVYEVR